MLEFRLEIHPDKNQKEKDFFRKISAIIQQVDDPEFAEDIIIMLPFLPNIGNIIDLQLPRLSKKKIEEINFIFDVPNFPTCPLFKITRIDHSVSCKYIVGEETNDTIIIDGKKLVESRGKHIETFLYGEFVNDTKDYEYE